jgi:hypothetical protein
MKHYHFINREHELVQLADAIDWDAVEVEFKDYFAEFGRPGVPIRKMVGLMLLKSLYNMKHWLTKVIFVFKTIYELLLAGTLDFFIHAQTRQTLMLAMSGFGKRRFWQV